MTGKLNLLAFLTVAATFPSCGGRAVDMGGADQGTGGNAGTASGGTGGTGGSHSTGGTGGSHSNGGTGGIGGTSGMGGTGGGYPGGTSGAGAYPGGGGSGAVSSGGGYGGDIQQTCGGAVCAATEICCYTSGQCFDPVASPGACAAPLQAHCAIVSSTDTPCGSDADCGSDAFCTPEYGCVGGGCCTRKDKCAHLGEPACGCDGQPYDFHSACAAGIHTMWWSCGTADKLVGNNLIACGNSSGSCPGGQQCCPVTGTCYDPSKPQSCALPPAGTYFPCTDGSDCPISGDICVGPTCGAPGGCVHQAQASECTGQWDPVCGCDGHTYVNAICAQASSIAIAHNGECGDAGM